MMFAKHSLSERGATRAGFSLIELLIAIAVMGIILAVAIPAFRNIQRNQRRKAARISIKNIQQSISFFEVDVGKYPESINDLVRKPSVSDYYDSEMVADWAEGGYIKGGKVPKDPWKNKFQYRLTPDAKRPYELYSFGPKGKNASRNEWIRAWND